MKLKHHSRRSEDKFLLATLFEALDCKVNFCYSLYSSESGSLVGNVSAIESRSGVMGTTVEQQRQSINPVIL